MDAPTLEDWVALVEKVIVGSHPSESSSLYRWANGDVAKSEDANIL